MPSHKLNITMIRNLVGSTAEIAAKMRDFGCPEDQPRGVIEIASNYTTVRATLVTAKESVIKRLNRKNLAMEEKKIEKDLLFPFCIRQVEPGLALLEVYAGGSAAIDKVVAFLSGELVLGGEPQAVPLDILSTIQKLQGKTQDFVLKSAQVGGYKHDDTVKGPFSPKFGTTGEGIAFLEEMFNGQEAMVKSVTGRMRKGFDKPVTVSFSPIATFSYACSDDDGGVVGNLLRSLAGVPEL